MDTDPEVDRFIREMVEYLITHGVAWKRRSRLRRNESRTRAPRRGARSYSRG
jgi:hypothetical protein